MTRHTLKGLSAYFNQRQRGEYTRRCRCPLCGVMLSFTHRDGVSVCKCNDVMCPASERWLEPDELQDYYQ